MKLCYSKLDVKDFNLTWDLGSVCFFLFFAESNLFSEIRLFVFLFFHDLL